MGSEEVDEVLSVELPQRIGDEFKGVVLLVGAPHVLFQHVDCADFLVPTLPPQQHVLDCGSQLLNACLTRGRLSRVNDADVDDACLRVSSCSQGGSLYQLPRLFHIVSSDLV